MIRTFERIIEIATKTGPYTMAVAAAQDPVVLQAVEEARKMGIIEPILVGDREEILRMGAAIHLDFGNYTVVHEPDKALACRTAVEWVRAGKVSILMKGLVDTSLILKAVLDKSAGLRVSGLLSHVGVLSVSGYDRFFLLSDSAMNIQPSLDDKVGIIRNAVVVAHALGNAEPKVALICPVEKVNPKIPATVDAELLSKMNLAGEITGCIVGGPFALDNAVSVEAAKHKNIDHEVAGHADVLVFPDLNSANAVNKSMEYFAGARKAGVIIGASTPIVLTSRASSAESKLNSIALAALVANHTTGER